MTILRETLLLLALSFAGATVTHFLHPRAPAWREVEEPSRDDEVTLDQVSRKWKSDVLWIDARPAGLFGRGHIPGAINIGEQDRDGQLIANLGVLQDNRKPVVVYCDSAACQASRKIRDYLAERIPGQEFFVLRRGWKAWQEATAARGG